MAGLVGDSVLEGVEVEHVPSGQRRTHPFTDLFVAIGHRPNTDLFAGLELDAAGYVVTAPGRSLTSVDGVFACGDVQDPIYRPAVTAAGSGCAAAFDAERWLEQQPLNPGASPSGDTRLRLR